MDWGGWRVPAAEYDRDPNRIEAQARLITHSPRLLELAEQFKSACGEYSELPADLSALAKQASDVLRDINSRPSEAKADTASKAA